MLTTSGQMYVTNEVNGAYVSGTEVNPDHPSTARKTKTATRTPRIVNAASRVMAANVRSPRRLVVSAWCRGLPSPGRRWRSRGLLWCSRVRTGTTAVPEGDRRTRLDQLAAICETIDVAFWDSAEVNGAEPAVFAAACWPAGETT